MGIISIYMTECATTAFLKHIFQGIRRSMLKGKNNLLIFNYHFYLYIIS